MSYEHIDLLVQRFREGDSEAAEELIRLFQPIIQRMFKFLRYGYVGSDEILAGLCKVYGEGNIAEGARIIADRLSSLDDDELMAEVHYCFLLAAHSSSNLQYGFRRNIARRVGHLLARKRRDIIYLQDIPAEHPSHDDELEMTEWVLGVTASEPFDRLSEVERELLYRRVVLEEPFCNIACELGMTERECISLFQDSIKRLRDGASLTSDGRNRRTHSDIDCGPESDDQSSEK